MVWSLTLVLPKCVHLQDLRHVSLMTKIYRLLNAATDKYMYFSIIDVIFST